MTALFCQNMSAKLGPIGSLDEISDDSAPLAWNCPRLSASVAYVDPDAVCLALAGQLS